MHSIDNKYAPPSFEFTWLKNNERDPLYNLRNANDYTLIHPRTETFKKSTLYSFPAAWNDLDPFVKYQTNKFTFKWALKAHLLDQLMPS